MHVCIVCMHVCVHVCMCVCMCVGVCACACVCMCVRMRVWICVHACMIVHGCVYGHYVCMHAVRACMHAFVYARMCVHDVCMHVSTYLCLHMYLYIRMALQPCIDVFVHLCVCGPMFYCTSALARVQQVSENHANIMNFTFML